LDQNLIPTSEAIYQLIQELSKLPGIGPKSAQRVTYYLLHAPEEQTRGLADAIRSIKERTRLCSICFNITDADPCQICQSGQRERNKICVVEQPQDILALEHTGIYHGLYHVLHGAISPTEGIGPGDLKTDELLERLKRGNIEEVILATNPTIEGETTASYLNNIIAPMGIRVTRLARGLPYGTELEYADDVTLTRAIEGRREF